MTHILLWLWYLVVSTGLGLSLLGPITWRGHTLLRLGTAHAIGTALFAFFVLVLTVSRLVSLLQSPILLVLLLGAALPGYRFLLDRKGLRAPKSEGKGPLGIFERVIKLLDAWFKSREDAFPLEF